MFGSSDRRVLRQIEQQNRRDDPAWVALFDMPRPRLRSSWFVISSTRRSYTLAVVAVLLLMAAAVVLGLDLLAFACMAVALATLAARRLVADPPVRIR